MKTIGIFALLAWLVSFQAGAQDISKQQVPAVILNNFQKSFPKATDIEWKKQNDLYKVEFEIGFWNDDRSAWYTTEGDLIRFKEDIAKKDLPAAVLAAIEKDYKNYWVKDAERITEKNKKTYKVELRSFTEEWNIIFDESGNELSKVAD